MGLEALKGIHSGAAGIRRDLSDLEKLTRAINTVLDEKDGRIDYTVPYTIAHLLTSFSNPVDVLVAYIMSTFDAPLRHLKEENRGLIAGAMLAELAKHHPDVSITIDGGGKRYNSLFRKAQYTGNLHLQNIVGHEICYQIATRGLATIYAERIKGNRFCANMGLMGTACVSAKDIEGEHAFAIGLSTKDNLSMAKTNTTITVANLQGNIACAYENRDVNSSFRLVGDNIIGAEAAHRWISSNGRVAIRHVQTRRGDYTSENWEWYDLLVKRLYPERSLHNKQLSAEETSKLKEIYQLIGTLQDAPLTSYTTINDKVMELMPK